MPIPRARTASFLDALPLYIQKRWPINNQVNILVGATPIRRTPLS